MGIRPRLAKRTWAALSSAKHKRYWPDASWSDWKPMSFPRGDLDAVAATAHGDHQKLAVADGALYLRWWRRDPDGQASWLDWRPLGIIAQIG